MSKIDAYRLELRQVEDWDAYLQANSCLPGPRANLELLAAAIEEGDAALFWRYTSLTSEQASPNTPAEFLAVVGTAGFGRLLAEGQRDCLAALRQRANDPRWRVREAVAIGMQRWGDADLPAMTAEAEAWASGSLLEQRAAVAALCEPRLLKSPAQVRRVLAILDQITRGILSVEYRRSEELRVLRKGLGYAWSVAVAADPSAGWPVFAGWKSTEDVDIRWIVQENLKKKRLAGIPGQA